MKKKILLLTIMLTLGMANLIGQYTVNYLGPISFHPTTPVKVYVKVNGVLIDSTLSNASTAGYNDSANSVTLPRTMEVYIYDCSGNKQSQTATITAPPGTAVFIFGYNALQYCLSTCTASFTKHQAVDPVSRLPIPNQVVIVNTSTGTSSGTTYSWNWGDGSYSSGATPTYTYSTHGTYVVCLSLVDSSTSCSSTFCDTLTVDSLGFVRSSFIITVATATASIEEKETITGIRLYPNPATNNLTVDFNSINSTNLNIQVMDIKGSIVMDFNNRVNAGSNMLKISLVDLERGMYFIKLNDGKTISTKKIQLVK